MQKIAVIAVYAGKKRLKLPQKQFNKTDSVNIA